MHPVGFSGAVTERSYAAVVFIPKEVHQCEWQCAMPRQLLAAAAEGQTVAGLSRCRGHGSGCVRSIRFCQAGVHSVPGRGLVRWPNAAARVLLNACAPATTSSPARGLLPRPLDKISIRDISARSLYEISVQALYKSSRGKSYVRDRLARSLQQISMQCLCTRFLYEISCAISLEEFSWQDLCKRPLRKISATSLYAMSLYKISIRGLLARHLKRSLYKKSPHKISVRDLKVRSWFKLPRKDLWARSLLSSPGLCTRSL